MSASLEKPQEALGQQGPEAGRLLCWDRVFLLYYYSNGRAHLSTWDDDNDSEYIRVLVRGCSPLGPPLWDAYPENATLQEEVPDGADLQGYRHPLPQGTFCAVGWYFAEPGQFMRHTRLTHEYRMATSCLSRMSDVERLSLWAKMSDRERDKIKESLGEGGALRKVPAEVVAWQATSRPGPRHLDGGKP